MAGGSLEKGSVTVKNLLSPCANDTKRTGARCPQENNSSPVSTFHSLVVASPEAVSNRDESSANYQLLNSAR